MIMQVCNRVEVSWGKVFTTAFRRNARLNLGGKFTRLYPDALITERSASSVIVRFVASPHDRAKGVFFHRFPFPTTRGSSSIIQPSGRVSPKVTVARLSFGVWEEDKERKSLSHVARHPPATRGGNAGGTPARSSVPRQPRLWVIKLILKRREWRPGSEWPSSVTIYYFSSSAFFSFFLQAKRRTEPFCVNSLIRKTLTSIVPLHFGGKIFHWFSFFFSFFLHQQQRQSKAGGAEKGLCVGLDSAGGLLGWVWGTCEVVWMLYARRGRMAASLLPAPLKEPITDITPHILQLVSITATQRPTVSHHIISP